MTRETDAVIFTRRDTWRKARDAALKEARGFRSTDHRRTAFCLMCAIEDAAFADGVILDRVPLDSSMTSP